MCTLLRYADVSTNCVPVALRGPPVGLAPAREWGGLGLIRRAWKPVLTRACLSVIIISFPRFVSYNDELRTRVL